MKIEGTIKKIYPSRRGISQKSGNSYCMTDIHFQWKYKEVGTDEQEHNAIFTVSGEPDMVLIQNAIDTKKMITAVVYFEVREWAPDRAQTQGRIYLPEGYVTKL